MAISKIKLNIRNESLWQTGNFKEEPNQHSRKKYTTPTNEVNIWKYRSMINFLQHVYLNH